jgi:hypothetical protein
MFPWVPPRSPHSNDLSVCHVCGGEPHLFDALPTAVYSYLLGVYLRGRLPYPQRKLLDPAGHA